MCDVAFLLSAQRHQENSVKTPLKRLAALLYLLNDRPLSMFHYI